MRIHLLLAATAGLFLTGAPPAVLETRASTAPYCGAAIVEISICLDWWMKRAEHDSLVAKARGGDRDAAATLAEFHMMAGEDRISHGWAVLAAERGHCPSIGGLLSRAEDRRDHAARRKWNQRFRWNKCDRSGARLAK
ncbi:hypothetical protein HNP52_000847 [Sphingomonas kyeonggiensis]|uniref:Sel1 repeat family protein n=1 Tax=Sphingomonas kyeonggiensis TaxID=1268553 RepID=A0A7W7NRH9_9SPHN|nr:hypothetical protein [Sphingomonas kyeonggiensis]MBB4837796.1 hypothetical protein [Sphingomonas kyeonggiensis]